MLFNSYVFLLLFLPIVLAVFFALGPQRNGVPAKLWLLAASLFFYAWWNPPYILLLLASIGLNYAVGGQIIAAVKQDRRTVAQRWLLAGVLVNLAAIGYYKYRDFFLGNVEALSGHTFALEPVFLPLAISFFTFQQIAYLVDAAKGKVHDHNPVDYALFVSFFPQLIAGPIVHHSDLIPQFRESAFRPDQRNMAEGIAFVVIGLIKKVLIADTLGDLSDPVFDSAAGTPPGLLESWIGLSAFTLGIYFDFSGYSDMAVGLARMMGIRLPYNFNSPYKARSIIDFWRRWHITLSDFLRDYVYIALGGNRRGKGRRYANLMLTMLVGGLWHGAGWTFVVWGALHGLYLMINHGWIALRKGSGAFARLHLSPRLAAAITLLAVMLAWVFFRAPTFPGAMAMLSGLVGLNGWSALAEQITRPGVANPAVLTDPDTIYALAVMLVGAVIVLMSPNAQEMVDRIPNREPRLARLSLRWIPNWRWAGAMGVGFLLALSQMSRVQEFIYFQF